MVFSKTVSLIDNVEGRGLKIIRCNANTSVTNPVTNPGKIVIHILPNLEKERKGKKHEVQFSSESPPKTKKEKNKKTLLVRM